MSDLSPRPETLAVIKDIIRQDLKLGTEEILADDMPLLGGEWDLDSLDVLLLLTSVEKRFGLKFPSESADPTIFQSITTLARFVEANASPP